MMTKSEANSCVIPKRFSPKSEPEKYKLWESSNKARIRSIDRKQLFASIQNFFWPTKLAYLPFLIAVYLAISLQKGVTPFYSGLISCGAMLLTVFSRQAFLYSLFYYRNWLLEVKPSTKTKLWSVLVKIVSSELSNWYSGNWLLPSLPAPPPLRQSVDAFVSSMEPVLTEDHFADLKKLGSEFVSKEGPGLQRKLMLKAWTSRNWLAQWWIDYGYLASRGEVYRGFMNGIGPPVASFPNDVFSTAAYAVHSTYSYFVHKLAVRELPPLKALGCIPMEMKYLQYITGGCRVPRAKGVDSFMWTPPWVDAYIIIHIRSHYFKLYLHDCQGQLLSPIIVKELLKEMHQRAFSEPKEPMDPCVYSYLPREQWAKQLEKLRADSHNDYVFLQIAKASFVLHLLDGPESFQDALDSMGDTQLQMWCDRSLNIVCTQGGHTYICCEHSHCDAVLLASLFNDTFLHYSFNKTTPEGEIDPNGFPKNSDYLNFIELKWNLCENDREDFTNAVTQVRASPNLKTRLCVKRVWVDKNLIKKNKMGPDSFFQCVIFWAYYRKHKRIENTYQPGTLMFFKDGRTENTRPVNEPKVRFVQAMEDDFIGVEEKVSLLRKAANFQHSQTRLSSVGQGCDRHLFGLYIIAKGTGVESKFLDYVMDEGHDFPLCTSVSATTLGLPEARRNTASDEYADRAITGGQFRPTKPDYYGIVYQVTCQTAMNITITDLECSRESNAFEMGEMIGQCFQDVFSMLKQIS